MLALACRSKMTLSVGQFPIAKTTLSTGWSSTSVSLDVLGGNLFPDAQHRVQVSADGVAVDRQMVALGRKRKCRKADVCVGETERTMPREPPGETAIWQADDAGYLLTSEIQGIARVFFL